MQYVLLILSTCLQPYITITQCACAVLYCHLWPARLCNIFPHYLINGTIFEEKLLNTKCAFWFSPQLLSETFLILRIQKDMIINVHKYHAKYPLFLSDFNETWIFWTDFRNDTQISDVILIGTVEAELFHEDRHDETKRRFSQFSERKRNKWQRTSTSDEANEVENKPLNTNISLLSNSQNKTYNLTFKSLLVTWRTTSLTFNNCTFCPHYIYVFCIYLRTNSDLCHLQHTLVGFYNRDEKCLCAVRIGF